MPLPNRPALPPYAGELHFGAQESPAITALSTQFTDISIENLRPVPRPPDPRWKPLPTVCDWISPVTDWEVLGNDRIGDCVPACMAHAVEAMTDAVGLRADITTAQTIRTYSDLTGYNPQTGVPDPGVVVANAMAYWASTGIAGHRIAGSNHTNAIGHPSFYPNMVQRSVFYLGSAILTFSISSSAMTAFRQGQPWVSGMSGGSDLHCVPALAYDEQWCEVITWGRPQRVSWGFVEENLREIWAVLSPDWIGPNGMAPCGVPQDLLGPYIAPWLTILAR